MKTNTPPGLILLHKPVGPSSHSALSPIKRCIGKKVGHSGTLDPFAEGLLLVLCGVCTKLQPLFLCLDKSYRCTVVFGKHTPSLDNTTAVEQYGKIPTRTEIENALPQFIGEIQQVPPQYSAIKVDGVRSYHNVRKGITTRLQARTVHIYSIDVVSYYNGILECDVVCSSGTYVRSLARDIASVCNTVAHLSALCRTAVGQFRLSSAVSADQFDASLHLIAPRELPHHVAEIDCIKITKHDEMAIAHGVPVAHLRCANAVRTTLQNEIQVVLLLAGQQQLRAACSINNNVVRYLFVCTDVQ